MKTCICGNEKYMDQLTGDSFCVHCEKAAEMKKKPETLLKEVSEGVLPYADFITLPIREFQELERLASLGRKMEEEREIFPYTPGTPLSWDGPDHP